MRVWLFVLALASALTVFAVDPAGELRGKIVQPASGPVFIDAGGVKIEISGDKDSNAVLHDPRLASYDVVLHGHLVDSSHFQLDPFFKKPILAMRDGRPVHVSYWCPVCSIRSYTPGKCWCCQNETDLDLHGDDQLK